MPTRVTTIQRGRFDGTGVETIIDRLLRPKFIVIGPGPEDDDGGPGARVFLYASHIEEHATPDATVCLTLAPPLPPGEVRGGAVA